MTKKSQGEPTPPDLMVELAGKLKPSSDVQQIPLQIEEKQAFLLYLKTVVDGLQLQNIVIKPFFELSSERHFEAYVNSLPNKVKMPAKEELLIELTKGNVLLVIQDRFVLLDLRKVNSDTVLQTTIEPTIHGPQLALSESLETNINLIRQRYHDSSLKIETMQLSDQSHRSIAILYDEKVVKKSILKAVKKKLNQLDTPLVQSSGDFQLYLTDKKFTLFPNTIITERPDRIIYNLTGGKVVLLVDGSPHSIVLPVVFFDFLVSMEDVYHAFWIAKLTILLRYIALVICITLPGLYVAVTSYSPEVFRTELALTVAGSRIGVPYPSFIEVLFMLVFIELLTEASIRLPKAISATATTVGGLILGTAVTEAALASNIMIIVVSLVAISTFVIPVNEMSYSMRISRLFLLGYASLFGLAGVILGFLGIIIYLVNRESFGEPYLRIVAKNREEEAKGDNK
ncbi:spore germination protein [Filibacter tadaridae]|uniref:Spore germination protein B1 n=1 Tax=Filibacter tadaridae TaxID=2483811 RepID=A0A3P5WVQ7_9BACL|nr:spore germination protein [Filibacter tadaridae]VDC22576.1 Spore germination protein B1 [Filibacter tadaridae]